jgi:hypothetical protein
MERFALAEMDVARAITPGSRTGGRLVGGETMKTQVELIEEFFWKNYPHEISWGELREANAELYCRMMSAGQALVLAGKLKSSYLPEGSC